MEGSTPKSIPVLVIKPYGRECNPKCTFCIAAELNRVIEVSDDDDDVVLVQNPARENRVSERFRFSRIRRMH